MVCATDLRGAPRARDGTILLAEDTTGKGHISEVTGDEDMLVLILMLPDDRGIEA
jgi:hypothetical protein